MSKPPVRVLFVCMGNICRSPAAEIVFRDLVEKAGWKERIKIDSAGTIGYHSGHAPDRRMAATLKARGYSILGSARQVTPQDLEIFDHILAADRENLADLRRMDRHGTHHSKIRLLTDHCQSIDADHVPDPYYGGQDGFERVADLVEDACQGLLEEIEKEL
ncbi:protein-tyrosine phosphatase [Haloferula luteola]|uniref:Protein-tyrosine phosphatase n=1 Tax=Haloferula luteola TaxID=595692 RepID=A0A840V2B6_9BACT|nr:low molecular weight protein-tyrosine-phosphatase [Haloferula luteola]MBB5349814.1 protein-tyrosine phosphatase [Haloferula luteola]